MMEVDATPSVWQVHYAPPTLEPLGTVWERTGGDDILPLSKPRDLVLQATNGMPG